MDNAATPRGGTGNISPSFSFLFIAHARTRPRPFLLVAFATSSHQLYIPRPTQNAMTNTDSIFKKKRHALVLGGNGFIGSHIVRSLIADGHAVTAVNRGTREWIGDPAMDASILPPTYDFAGGDGITAFRGDASYPRSNKEVAHIICDRKKRKAFADAVDVATGTTLGVDGSWDVVVDLSGFTPRDLRAALTGLKGRTRRYVFVSSDSVYEVCEPREGDSRGGTKEGDARRPAEAARAEALARTDMYGHHKLRCEEILGGLRGAGTSTTGGVEAPDLSSSSSSDAATWSDDDDDDDGDDTSGGSDDDVDSSSDEDEEEADDDELTPVPFLALRLPDVIGPRDGTHRLWRYQMWVQCVDVLGPVLVPDDLARGGARRLSFVYAPDVAALVSKVAKGECDSRLDRSYNLACVERVSLEELVEYVAESVGVGPEGTGGRRVVEVRGTRGGVKRDREGADEDELKKSRSPAPKFYPSVDGGPIDPSAAIAELGFTPTPLRDAVRETVNWCDCIAGAGKDVGGKERGEAARRLRKSFGFKLFSPEAKALQKALRRLGFPEPRDRWGNDPEC